MIDYSKYEPLFTKEQIELNARLYNECSKEKVDFALVEELLKLGADPLGPKDDHFLTDHLFGELVCDYQEIESVNLPRITELFVKYGMDITKPLVGYDQENSINPLWDFSFCANENGIGALKVLLDHGLGVEDVGVFLEHATFDAIDIDRADPNDSFYHNAYSWMMRMIMLVASYPHILENDSWLQTFIRLKDNDYDLLKFRNWNDFYFEFDTSHCEKYREFYRSIVSIYEVGTKEKVWTVKVWNPDQGEF